METREFKTLINACLKNKRKHQKILYHSFYKYGFGIALRYANSSKDAALIANKGFYRVFVSLIEYNDNQPFREWLRAIMIQAAIDYYIQANNVCINIKSFPGDAGSQRVAAELSPGQLIKLLHNLPDQCRIIFNLFAIDGYDHQVISKFLRISIDTSKKLLIKARLILSTQSE